MNEQAQKILLALLQKASSGIDSAASFSQAQIPDVVHQLLVWNFAASIIYQAISILSVISVLFWVKKLVSDRASKKAWTCHRLDTSSQYSSDFFDGVCIFTGIIGAVIFMVCLICFFSSFDWLKIWLAPKLYLIEYAASLVK